MTGPPFGLKYILHLRGVFKMYSSRLRPNEIGKKQVPREILNSIDKYLQN